MLNYKFSKFIVRITPWELTKNFYFSHVAKADMNAAQEEMIPQFCHIN